MTERVVLAYSGGLDTSVGIGWLHDATGKDVVALAVDVGQGGEDMEAVLGRAEEEELPRFAPGALELSCRPFLAAPVLKNVVRSPLMEGMLDSIREAEQLTCSTWDDTPTILIARLDYADLFHAFTELFQAYTGLRALGAIDAPY